MSRVFISYATEDRAAAERVRRTLHSHGLSDVFVDKDPEQGIRPGAEWAETLYRSIRAAEVLVAVHSKDFRRSRWCLVETALAQSSGRIVVPVLVDDAPLDDNLTYLQAIDCSAGDFGPLAEYFRALRLLGQEPAHWDRSRSPYPGLRPLELEDAAVFFGREADQEAVLEALERQNYEHRLSALLVQGGSGVSKSSFVHAGIMPALRRRPAQWLVTSPLRRYTRPVLGLLETLTAEAGMSTAELADVEQQVLTEPDPGAVLSSVLDSVLRTAARPPGCRAVIVLDQVEGLTASSIPHAELDAFVRIMRSVFDQSVPLFAVMAVRSDAFPAVASMMRIPPRAVHEVGLGPLDVAGLARIIEEPARVAGIEIDAGPSALMAAESGGVSALPLLSFAVRQMYEKGRGRLLTADYERLGGVRNAVIGQLNFLAEPHVGQRERRALEKGFGALVMTTREGGFVRRTAEWSEFEPGSRAVGRARRPAHPAPVRE